jgi:hypothetical protein
MTNSNSFAQRQNYDSSIDSICTKCYQTIATANSAAGLENAEQTHHCDPYGESSFKAEELPLEAN